ncbi:hypothetical protein LCGC14_2469210 [marine sediment metagenome]|uniref:Uncharacterized protein n=1 Tax=marine sediment metagenome TaxID=412755 RepID=A0A0F9BYN8_9ZZZZ
MERAVIERKIRRLERLTALLERDKQLHSDDRTELLTTISIKTVELLNQLNLTPLPG